MAKVLVGIETSEVSDADVTVIHEVIRHTLCFRECLATIGQPQGRRRHFAHLIGHQTNTKPATSESAANHVWIVLSLYATQPGGLCQPGIGGVNPLYAVGGPRSGQFSLKVIF